MQKVYSTLICALSSLVLTTASVEADLCPNCSYPLHVSYPAELYGCHAVKALDAYSGMIELQDGSRWLAADDDRFYLLSWDLYDPLTGRRNLYTVITPNHTYSDYGYYLTNQANDSYVRVNLVEGPIVGGEFTLNIHGFDANTYHRRSLYLSNGTCWAIADADFAIMDSWQLDQPIIIGHNDAWFTKNSSILINVSTNTFVRARKL